MKKILLAILIAVGCVSVFSGIGGLNFTEAAEEETVATNEVNIYLFWGEGCPHCAKENVFLDKYTQEHPEVNINRYEINNNAANRQLLKKIGSELGLKTASVPVTIINDTVIYGYLSDEATGQQITKAVKDCQENVCDDPAKEIVAGSDGQSDKEVKVKTGDPTSEIKEDKEEKPQNIPEKIKLPLFGEIDTTSISLPVLTIAISAVDGFNPCAMWVLLFLISLLLGMKNRRRMWILGIAFIVSSALSYFLFLSAWLNLFLFIGFIVWVRVIIGLFACGSGIYHLRDYWKNKDRGCVAAGGQKRKLVFEKLKQFSNSQKFWVALSGIILIAFAINLVELICSAGLPAIYTNILSLSDIPKWQYYMYLLLYIFIFMLDDLIVFFIAMITLRATGISKKYSKYSGLIGGIIILILGILLLFKPEWLMFG